MKNHALDAVVASTPENVSYISGFWSISHRVIKGTQTFAVYPADTKISPFVITPVGELDQAAILSDCRAKEFASFGKFFYEIPPDAVLSPDEELLKEILAASPPSEDAVAALVQGLEERGLARGRIALDEMNTPAPLYRAVEERLPGAEVLPGYSIFREMRSVKTAEEVALLERAAALTEQAFHRSLAVIREGVRESEIAQVFNTVIAQGGGLPVFTCIGAGVRSAFPNVRASDSRVKKGDLIRYDIGCLLDNYYSDTARIAVLGEPDEKQRLVYQAVLEGENRGLELIRPGARACEIFEASVRATREAGIPHYRRAHVGHGIGAEFYEIPYLSPSSDHVLR
ncbi:MAG TPA: Xaa-Pro peptidase family protein, partial [Thermodesulfobacteriota bacterium]|nr:Xaa-Pro peptidase family protein [Thermodesulfobacteriota bacterium]